MLRNPPDVLITTPESLYLMLTSRAREMFAGVEWCIVDEIHAVARTKRGAHLALTLERLQHASDHDVQRIGLSATQKPLEEVGRFLVGAGRDCRVVDTGVRKPLDLEIRVPVEDMREPAPRRPTCSATSQGDDRGRHPPLDLARDLPRAAGAGAGPPLHDHLRERPPRRRAAGGAAERAGGRGGQARRDRPRPPRLARARGAAGGGGPAQVGRAAVPGGHLVAGAGHRHGRGGPGAAGGVAEVGDRRAPAHRPRRPQRGRRLQGPHLPQVPRRPARVRRGRAPDARRRDRDHRGPAQPARRAGAADRGDGGHRRRLARARAARAGEARLSLRRPQPRAARQRARHARRPLPLRRVRRAAPADRVGPGRGHDPRAQGRAAAGGDQRRHDPRPRPVRRAPARRPPRGRAGRGDGLRGARGPDVHARRVDLADRGDHPRPRDRDARARRPGRAAVLARRRRGPARSSWAARSASSRATAVDREPARAGEGVRPRRARRRATWSPTCASSGRPRA